MAAAGLGGRDHPGGRIRRLRQRGVASGTAGVAPVGGGRLCVAHLNHCLRPDAADNERFVVELCNRLQVRCEVGRADVAAAALRPAMVWKRPLDRPATGSLPTRPAGSARRFVVIAHTANDQVETILHRIVRGTGLRGLAGMPRSRQLGHATLIRPLLGVGRAELRAYLGELGSTLPRRPEQRPVVLHAKSRPCGNCCPNCGPISTRRRRRHPAAGTVGR